jgi:hypothetical protein
MGGQSAFGFYDYNTKLISYYFMGDSAANDIKAYVREPYNVLKDSAQPLIQGQCSIEEFKSSEFHEEHDLVCAAIILPHSIVCFDEHTVTIHRKRKH